LSPADSGALAQRKGAITRYMKAYRETIAYMYSDDPRVMKDYGEFAGISEAMAKRVRDDFFPPSLLNPDEIHGLDGLMAEAVTLKFIATPLSKEQVAELIQIVK
jgi:NitT/TauT family transport system substrate-binding protein